MDDALSRRRRRLQAAAWLVLVLLAAVVVSSAFMRHRSGGLGCTPWPVCYGQPMVEDAADITAARVVHRIAASVVLVLVAVLALAAWTDRPAMRRQAGVATLLCVLACALAVLGALTPGSRLPALAIGNLLGGLAMLALALRWFEAPRGLGWAAVLVALLVALQIAAGGLVSSSYAATSCVSWQDCVGQARAAGWSMAPLDPWRAAALHGDGAIVQLAHRALGAVAGVALAALAALAWRRGRRRAACGLAGLLLLQATLGWAVAAHGGPLALVLLHNALAAALLALAIRLA